MDRNAECLIVLMSIPFRAFSAAAPFGSLAGIDALVGVLRRGILGTISVPTETEITWQYQGGVWLMTQSCANPSQLEIPCEQGNLQGIFKKLDIGPHLHCQSPT